MLFLVENLEIIDNIINRDIFYIDCFWQAEAAIMT